MTGFQQVAEKIGDARLAKRVIELEKKLPCRTGSGSDQVGEMP